MVNGKNIPGGDTGAFTERAETKRKAFLPAEQATKERFPYRFEDENFKHINNIFYKEDEIQFDLGFSVNDMLKGLVSNILDNLSEAEAVRYNDSYLDVIRQNIQYGHMPDVEKIFDDKKHSEEDKKYSKEDLKKYGQIEAEKMKTTLKDEYKLVDDYVKKLFPKGDIPQYSFADFIEFRDNYNKTN